MCMPKATRTFGFPRKPSVLPQFWLNFVAPRCVDYCYYKFSYRAHGAAALEQPQKTAKGTSTTFELTWAPLFNVGCCLGPCIS